MNLNFSSSNDLSEYISMYINEHRLGTNDYRPHDKNEMYWNFLLSPIIENKSYWDDKKALDFGTGLGRNIKNLKNLSNWNSLYGVDLSDVNLNKLKSMFDENCHFYKSNGKNLKLFKENSFDFVISTLVFQHVPVYELRKTWLEEIYRVMKTNGVFTFQMGFGKDTIERAYPDHYFCLMRTGTLTTPSRLKVASYYDNVYDAIGSNGEYDCRVTDVSQILNDLKSIGYKNTEYIIDESFDDFIHKKWIYLKTYK